MTKRVRLALMLFGLAFLVAAPARAAWMEASSHHFLIYGDMSEAQIRAYANRLERYDGALRFFTHVPDRADGTGNRVTVYLLADLAAVQQLHGSRHVAGFYQASAQGSTAFMPRILGDGEQFNLNAMEVMHHEYAHHILLSGAGDYYPGWVSEGLAEFFMTARMNADGSVVIGAPDQARAYSVMAMNRMSMPDLLGSDGRSLDPERMEQKYSRGWLLIHYLLLGTQRVGQFDTYLRLIAGGTPSREAGLQAFGDLGRLDRELDGYRRRPRIPIVTVPADRLSPGPIAVRQLRPGEAAMMPTRIVSARGVNAQMAPRLVAPARRVAAAYPDDPWVQRALAEVEFDAQNTNEAEAAADRALALEPNSVMALVYKGRAHVRRAAAAPGANAEVWREARSWYLRANRIDPNFALPLVLFYDSFIRAGQAPTANAVTGLLRAIQLVPQDSELHVRVAREMLRQNDLPAARRAIAPLAYNPHGGNDNPALTILRLIDSGADRAAIQAAVEHAHWDRIGQE